MSISGSRAVWVGMAITACAVVWPGVVLAQTRPAGNVKPPIAQLWVDVATASMAGMPEMPAMPSMAGGMFGGGERGNRFGNAQAGTPGHWADIALYTQRKPNGTEGTQAVPDATGLAPTLSLQPVKSEPPARRGEYEREDMERPKGRILFYWGCGETVRPGQPKVLDFSKAGVQEWGAFMQGRAQRDRGALAKPGHAVWPNEVDGRSFGRNASLAGDHAVSGEGVPASFKFAIPPAQDFMPTISLSQQGALTEAVKFSWSPVNNARAYFLNAMGGKDEEMVFWSSSEVPDFGMGLIDYLSPANVDRWLKERVLLATTVTQCAIPNGIFAKADGAMLRMIAYGPELNLAYPPRPADPKAAWEPEWAVRLRTKSTTMAMVGRDMGESRQGRRRGDEGRPAPRSEEETMPAPVQLLKGLFGR